MTHRLLLSALLLFALGPAMAGENDVEAPAPALPFEVVDTGQERCYDAHREIRYPKAQQAFFGQDAQYVGNEPRYEDLGDGTVLDLVTGLMWQKSPGAKMLFGQAVARASKCRTAGHEDWRLPTIKELYSLILFSGVDVHPHGQGSADPQPFIDTRYFDFSYGDPARGERLIDSQWATCTKYVSTTMHGAETMFGVNFADGRIKGYGLDAHPGRGEKTFFVLYVRGNPGYGRNDFVDNKDGTITDRATGLTWMKKDEGPMNWQQALAWAEGLEHAGHSDWRLPNAKELQSIVDYTRSPDTTDSAAIDPVFEVSKIRGEDGRPDYPFYWTGTTHVGPGDGSAGVYVAFGRCTGWMRGRRGYQLLDVHGAGSQRSDPKDGDAADHPRGRGPQGDVVRILNYVRCVRGGKATPRRTGPALLPVTRRRGPPPRGPGR